MLPCNSVSLPSDCFTITSWKRVSAQPIPLGEGVTHLVRDFQEHARKDSSRAPANFPGYPRRNNGGECLKLQSRSHCATASCSLLPTMRPCGAKNCVLLQRVTLIQPTG